MGSNPETLQVPAVGGNSQLTEEEDVAVAAAAGTGPVEPTGISLPCFREVERTEVDWWSSWW